MEQKYTIHWNNRKTFLGGHGTAESSKDVAEQIAEQANKDFPELYHWIVPVKAEKDVPYPDESPIDDTRLSNHA